MKDSAFLFFVLIIAGCAQNSEKSRPITVQQHGYTLTYPSSWERSLEKKPSIRLTGKKGSPEVVSFSIFIEGVPGLNDNLEYLATENINYQKQFYNDFKVVKRETVGNHVEFTIHTTVLDKPKILEQRFYVFNGTMYVLSLMTSRANTGSEVFKEGQSIMASFKPSSP